MKNITKFALTGALILGTNLGFNLYGQNTNKEIPCLSNKEVKFIVSEIPKYFKPKYFKQINDTYLIENIPEAKNGYEFGGQLSVYIPVNVESGMSIFDRTNLNPSKWYNVSNWKSENKGCVDMGIYLNVRPTKYLSKSDAQKKFNEFIYKVEKIMKEKQK